MLYYDNLACHTSLTITACLTSKGILVVAQSPHLTWTPVTFYFFLNLKMFQRTSIRNFRKHPIECKEHAEDHIGWRLPVLLPKVETTPPSVCSCPRELFWRDNIDVKKIKTLEIKNSVSLLSCQTSYNTSYTISLDTKKWLGKAMVEWVAWYTCEVWLLKTEEQRKLLALEIDYLRSS